MNTSVATPRRWIYSETAVRRIIAIDGVLNVIGAIVLWAAASTWMAAFGLGTSLPITALGALFVVNGIECWIAARRPAMSPGWLSGLAAVDAVFGVFALVVAATDPTGAESWARWTLAAIGDAAVAVGAVKAYAAYRIARGGASSA